MPASAQPEVGVDLTAPQPQVVYAMASDSKLSNAISVAISNPTNQDIPWAAGARIEIVLYTTEAGDPRAMTTPAAALNVHADVSGCERAWSLKPAQGSDSCVLTLYPVESNEPLLRHGDSGQLTVSLSGLRSDLPVTEEPIPFLVRAIGFPGLADNLAPFSFTRQACPTPSGTLLTPPDTLFGQPQLCRWDLQWVDAIVVSFSDGCSPDTVFNLDASSACVSSFQLRDKVFLSGKATIKASNASNPGFELTLEAPTTVSGASCRVKKTLRVAMRDGDPLDDNKNWEFDYPNGPTDIPAPSTSIGFVADSPSFPDVYPGKDIERFTTTASISFFDGIIAPTTIVAQVISYGEFDNTGRAAWVFRFAFGGGSPDETMGFKDKVGVGMIDDWHETYPVDCSLHAELCDGGFIELTVDFPVPFG
jgi:hypothetical protein